MSVPKVGLSLLREPFPPHQISKLPKPTKKQTDDVKANFQLGIRCKLCGAWHHPDVVHLDYVGHAALTDRLLDADENWTWEPLSLTPEGLPKLDMSGGLWIKLTVSGLTRLGYGHAGDKTGGDAVKELIGDALRNAAMRFGAALDLWHKGDLHGDDDEITPKQTNPPPPPRQSPPTPMSEHQAPKPQPMVNHAPQAGGGISEAQGKRLFALKMKAGWKDFELKDVLDRVYSVDHSMKLDRTSYKELTDFLEANGSANELLKQKGF